MKLETFDKRTQKFNKTSKGYQLALQLMKGESTYSFEKCVRTCHTSGRGRFCKNMDYTDDTLEVLRYAGMVRGVDFEFGNDAPKGGLTGNYLKLTAKGRKKIIKS